MKEYQNAPTLCESIAIILVLILYYYFSMNGNIVFAHCGFLIFSVWTFFKNVSKLFLKFAAKPAINLFFSLYFRRN